jgi:hypothetical protein
MPPELRLKLEQIGINFFGIKGLFDDKNNAVANPEARAYLLGP